ncbi:ribose-5-phosphate isomerase A [Streptomyces sp. NPDC059447]|uniref:ribose-5-phosphate isomerase A n=1 Tax=Streptomyces sp. NPDC059447 TaxID=3346834 RepID=UPI0036771235
MLDLRVEPFGSIDRFDITIDGADQIAPDGWLVKGGGVIAGYHGAVDDPAGLAALLGATPGVVEHGLFPPTLAADVFVARGDSVEHHNHAKSRA